MKTKSFFLVVIFGVLFSITSGYAGVGTSLMQTAPTLSPGEKEAKLQNDIILNNNGGFNISPHLRLGLVEHFLDVDTFVGTGTTDFQMGALAKYNILPDVEGQVGLSLLAGLSYIRDEKINSYLTSFGFVTSKETELSFARATPYAALQVEAFVNSVDSTAPITLIVGNRWQLPDMKWVFYSELGIDVNDSHWNLGLGVSYPF